MRFTVSKRAFIISIVSIIVISTLSLGGYYYYNNYYVSPGIMTSEGGGATGEVYLSSYRETGFLIESAVEGAFWRFETILPIFQGYFSDGGRDYIDALITTSDGENVQIGIYVSGELDSISEDPSGFQEYVWVRPQYDNEDVNSDIGPGNMIMFKDLKEDWDIKMGDQFETYILANGPDDSVLDLSCSEEEFELYCTQSFVNASKEFDLYGVYVQGISFKPGEKEFIEVFPYFIGRKVE